MHTSFDLSAVGDLRPLADVSRTVSDTAAGIVERWLIIGATARDLILRYVHGLAQSRKTVDLDIAVGVASWEVFARLEKELIANGATPVRGVAHAFLLRDWKIDVIPFGGVEENGVIVWPPANDHAMSVVGFTEASENAMEVILPGQVRVLVASPAGLLILKLIAWKERHWSYPRYDAVDIRTLLVSYSESWNEDRLYDEAGELLRRFQFDNTLAGAALLGRDAAAIAKPVTLQRIQAILETETAEDAMTLAADMGFRTEDNLKLLEALLFGIRDAR